MSFHHSTMRPFAGPTSAPNMLDDYRKPGRTTALWQWWWIRVLHSDYSDADTSQALNLADLADALIAAGGADAARCSGALPEDAIFGYWSGDLREVFDGAGVSAAAFILGPEGVDDNGFLTTTNVTTGASLGRKQTASAALWTPQPLAADPALQLDTTGNINLLETGCIDIYAAFLLNPESQYFGG